MKMNKILAASLFAAGMATLGTTGCQEGELYDVGEPDWLEAKKAEASQNGGNNQGGSEGIDKNNLGVLFQTFTSSDFNFPQLHVEAQVGTWKFTSSDGKYTDEEIIGSAWWSAQSIDANAEGSNWTSSDFMLEDGELLLTLVPQTENAVVMYEIYGNGGYWTMMTEGNWWFAEAAKDGETPAKGEVTGYNSDEMGMYHWAVGSTVNVLVKKSGKNYTVEVYGPAIEDYEASSIKLEGIPATMDFSKEMTLDDLTKTAKVTVGFNNDAFTKEVSISDCHFSISPDLTTPGEKTITVVYYLTNEGEAGNPVVGNFNVNLINTVKSISVTTQPTQTSYFFNNKWYQPAPDFNPAGMVVTTDGGDVLSNDVLKFSAIEAKAGKQKVTISYDKVSTEVEIDVAETTKPFVGVSGLADKTGGWYNAATMSQSVKVNAGETMTAKFKNYGGASDWANFVVALTEKGKGSGDGGIFSNEWGCVVPSNLNKWGSGVTDALEITNDLPAYDQALWDGADVEVSVTNNGGTSANIACTFKLTDGNTYHVTYKNFVIGGDLYITIAADSAYITFE